MPAEGRSPRAWRFFQPAALGRNNFWRYLVVNLAVIAASIGASILAALGALLIEGSLNLNQWSELTVLVAGMLPFPAALVTLALGHHFLHQRPFRVLLTPFRRIAWGRLLISGGLWFALAGISDLLLSIMQPGNYSWSFEPRRFIPYALLSLLLIPIQTSTEELLFRAYLPQGLSRLARSVWLPVIVSSLVFGLLHGVNPEVDLYGTLFTMPYYIGIGALLILVTLYSESLEPALGLHAANNLYAATMVTFPGSALPAPALFSIQAYDAALSLGVFFIMALIYAAVLRAMGFFKPRQEPLFYSEALSSPQALSDPPA